MEVSCEPILGIAVGDHVINVHVLLLCQEPSIQRPVRKEEMVSSVLLLTWDQQEAHAIVTKHVHWSRSL